MKCARVKRVLLNSGLGFPASPTYVYDLAEDIWVCLSSEELCFSLQLYVYKWRGDNWLSTCRWRNCNLCQGALRPPWYSDIRWKDAELSVECHSRLKHSARLKLMEQGHMAGSKEEKAGRVWGVHVRLAVHLPSMRSHTKCVPPPAKKTEQYVCDIPARVA